MSIFTGTNATIEISTDGENWTSLGEVLRGSFVSVIDTHIKTHHLERKIAATKPRGKCFRRMRLKGLI